MVRQLLATAITVFFLSTGNLLAQQNDLRITYDANQGVSQLAGANKVYMYSGAVTSSPSASWEWIVGSPNVDDGIGQMSSLGNDLWTICINPMSYYSSGVAGVIPAGTPILAIDMFFRNENGTATGYNFNGSYIILDMTTTPPTSNFNGVVAATCAVGEIEIPLKEFVMNNFPNPVKTNTLITYNLKSNARNVVIKVYDVIGQNIKTFRQEAQKSGVHKIAWNGDNDKGALLKNGLYFYSLEVDGVTLKTNRMILSR
ncbi:MAG: T9SS type A sorting domain-containing protein [Bacteroidota bacterium]|nr:T9SS type A sorting domain-containing protein [Bacteroidota bacterium]